ncbi:hypothetical protein L484_019713 [Morus notabilis]|uniref:Uncharacterized protein n=1 Tax=Morus notabilis TaxID=981085 RepID=W9QYQ4_9ROSA|nr:hypothetical protein L484_019713 [Morus notabilis]
MAILNIIEQINPSRQYAFEFGIAIQNFVPQVLLKKPKVSTAPEFVENQGRNDTQEANCIPNRYDQTEPVLFFISAIFFMSFFIFRIFYTFFGERRSTESVANKARSSEAL